MVSSSRKQDLSLAAGREPERASALGSGIDIKLELSVFALENPVMVAVISSGHV